MEEVKCPKCESEFENVIIGTDESEFSNDGTGHVFYDHSCKCGHQFRSYTYFTYKVTEQYTRG